MADASGFEGTWSRINVFLPINTAQERLAAARAIRVVSHLYGGATHSTLRPHTFVGYWWDEEAGRWVRDEQCWLTTDAPYAIGQAELEQDVELIKLEILDLYHRVGSPQQIVWIMVYQEWRAS